MKTCMDLPSALFSCHATRTVLSGLRMLVEANSGGEAPK